MSKLSFLPINGSRHLQEKEKIKLKTKSKEFR